MGKIQMAVSTPDHIATKHDLGWQFSYRKLNGRLPFFFLPTTWQGTTLLFTHKHGQTKDNELNFYKTGTSKTNLPHIIPVSLWNALTAIAASLMCFDGLCIVRKAWLHCIRQKSSLVPTVYKTQRTMWNCIYYIQRIKLCCLFGWIILNFDMSHFQRW